MQTKAQQYKNQGNDEFTKGRYQEAIDLYSKAIAEDNTQSIFFSNRGKCYYLLKKFDLAYDDALQAVELDDKNIKAHLLSGQVICMQAKELCKSSKIDTAISRVLKARTLCAGQKKAEFEKEIDDKLNRARKLKWYIAREEDKIKNQQTVAQLQHLVNTEKGLSREEKEITLKQIEKYIRWEEPKLEIPEFLQCKISKKLLLDPYTTQAGYSYEKAELEKLKPLNTDPYSKVAINPQHVFQNINLKQAAEDFLQRNPWAYDFQENTQYTDIEL